MFTRKGLSLIFLCVTVWMTIDIKIEAYLSGCNGGYCFTISDISHNSELLDQSNAQQWCRANGSQLVEILNQDIQSSLVNFIRTAYSQGVNSWNVLTNGKRTTDSSFIRLSGNGIGGLTVSDQTDSSYAYGYLKSARPTSGLDLFASRPTDSKGGFICTGLTDCSGGATISGQCYKSFTETLSWYDARNRCLDAGGDLASFENITSNAGFNALNGSWISASSSYWIGFRREWWKWQTTSSDVKYSAWITGHPINDVGRTNSDCLCLSTTEWKWIECGSYEQRPFVCVAATPTTTTTQSTSSTTRSTATYSATIVSRNNGVSSLTEPTTGISKSTVNGTAAGSGEQIGIGVGVGVGGALIVIALVAVVIILCRKRCPNRCPERKKTNAKPQPPDILMKNENDNPYALVVPSSPELNNTDPTIVYTNDTQTHTVYAPLGFQDGSVAIVAGKAQPSPVPISPNNNVAANHFKVGGDLYAEVTKA